MAKLFSMSNKVYENNLNVILIQIDEAHSDEWPVAIDTILGVPQPKSQQTFQDRVDRANHFVTAYKPPYPVYVDGWDNIFAETFRAWPDKYHCLDKDLKVISKAEYGTSGINEAKIVMDYTDLLEQLINTK